MGTYGCLFIPPFVFVQWGRCSAQDPLTSLSAQKPKVNLKMQLWDQGITLPGISTLSIQTKTNHMPSTFLTKCHNHHLSFDQWSLIVRMSSWQIPLCCNLLWEWVDVCPWTSLSGHSPLLHCVGEMFFLTNLPSAVRKGPDWLHHQCWQKSWVLRLLPWQFLLRIE